MSLILVSPADIRVPPERQRSEFDEKPLLDLIASIERIGVIHPIVVEKNGDGWNLIAGERRLRACKAILAKEGGQIPFRGHKSALVPILEHSDLSDEQRFEMELEENIQRVDLTFMEKALALAKLHEWRQKIAPPEAPPVTIAATAVQAKVAPETVSAALLIAQHKDNEQVKGAANAKEALKIIKNQANEAHRAELAKRFDLTKTPHMLRKGPVEEILPTFDAGLFDHILTDPPYGIGADGFGDQAGTGHEYNDDPVYIWGTLLPFCAQQWFRLSKPTSSCFVFCAYEGFDRLRDIMNDAGFLVWPRPLIWNKGGNGMLPVPEKGPRYSYECILQAYRIDFKVVKQAMPDVLTYSPVKNLLHGAQKPAALYADLLGRVALPGQRILDSFAGSGTIFLAANTLRLNAAGVEGSEKSFNLALSRINLTVQNEPIDTAPDLAL